MAGLQIREIFYFPEGKISNSKELDSIIEKGLVFNYPRDNSSLIKHRPTFLIGIDEEEYERYHKFSSNIRNPINISINPPKKVRAVRNFLLA